MTTATMAMIVTVLPMPTLALTVSRMTPASGSVSGGNLVTIKGEIDKDMFTTEIDVDSVELKK